MRLSKGKKRVLVALGSVLGTFLVIWFSAPLWFPWIARPVAAKYGLQYQRLERQGYSHFTLHGAGFTNEDVRVSVGRAEALIPTVWLWRLVQRTDSGTPPFVRAENCTVEVLSRTESQPAPAHPSSTFTNVWQTRSVLAVLRRWIPVATVANGVVRTGDFEIDCASATWRNGYVVGNVFTRVGKGKEFPAAVNADLGGVVPHTIEIVSDPLQLRSEFRVWLEEEGLRIESSADWRTNQLATSVTFDRTGGLPSTASFKALNVRVPGKLLKLEEYREVAGDVEANWTNGSFNLKVLADGVPAASTTNFPPARLEMIARGDTNAAVIESLKISSPWAKASLTENVLVNFTGPIVREPARLEVEADLQKQPWTELRGILTGQVDLTPDSGRYPAAEFKLSGTNVGNSKLAASRVELSGRFSWPSLSVTNAVAILENGSEAALGGQFDFLSREISNAHARFNGALPRDWVPEGYSLSAVGIDVEVSGPLTNLIHRGNLTATNFAAARLRPLQVEGRWEGNKLNVRDAVVKVGAGPDSLTAEFSTRVEPEQTTPMTPGSRTEVSVQQLTLRTNGQTALSLIRPALFQVERLSHLQTTNDWRLSVAELEWHGPAGGLSIEAAVRWPEQGRVTLLATNLDSSLLARFAPIPPDTVLLNRLGLRAGWTNGPVAFALTANGVVTPAGFGKGESPATQTPESGREQLTRPAGTLTNATDQRQGSNELFGPLTVQIEAAGNGEGLTISNLNVNSEKSPVVSARGLLPMTINPNAPSNMVQMDTARPVEIKLATTPDSIFWEKLTDWTGVVLRQPDFKADVSGTWAAPEGTVRLRASQIKLRKAVTKLPDMERLEVDLGLTRNAAVLTNFSVLVQGQKVSGTAEVPLGEKFWAEWREKKMPNWDQARGQLRIEHANIAAFAGMFPTVLSPQGEFDLNVTLEPGLDWNGALAVRQARTRPLPGIGAIRDIEVRMLYVKKTAKLQEARASIGGSVVMAAGEGDLSGTDWLKGVAPPFELVLQGTNVPLSRQADSIIRSDLNLAVKKTNGGPAVISGTAKLHDSFYLSDLAALVPGRAASPERRPPYFSVEEPGLADWRLAVRVTGEKALKVRSTLFNGVVSPNLRLQGTLEEPVALGDVRVESGMVRFPFANLEVQQGLVTLGSEDPYRPRLLVKAGSKQYGYEVRMEVSGPADDPVIQFTSTPSLSSEQLVLMVTAGELPRGSYTLNPEQRAETMALFLGKDMLAKLGFGDSSKERLSFSSGKDISEEGKPTYNLEYKLNDRWSLVGEYDRFNAFNAGVKWKVYSR